MKNKIKIMNTRPEITDDEIRTYMSFDQLLVKKEKSEAQQKSRTIIRNISLSAIVGATILGLWLFLRIDQKEAVRDTRKNASENKTNKPAPVIAPQTDTVTSKKKQTKNNPGQQRKPSASPKKDAAIIIDSATSLKHSTEKPVTSALYHQATPVAGYPSLYDYFTRELSYPAEALKDSIQGVVTVAFTINTAGKSEKISIEQSLGDAFDREAIRLIENMPPWTPATYNGKFVPSRISLPITFQIKNIKTSE